MAKDEESKTVMKLAVFSPIQERFLRLGFGVEIETP